MFQVCKWTGNMGAISDRQGTEGTTRRAPVDRIERWSIKKLVPYAKNPRLHTDDQVSQIANSMREFGQTQLVVVDERGEIIAGHGRIRAAEQLGWKDVAVGIAIGWSSEQKRAYRVADNALALSGVWDQQLLSGEVTDLKLGGFNLNLLGFDNAELTLLTADRPVDGADPDAAPAPSPTPIVERGDLWVLGGHRILAGDATNADDVASVMDGKKAVLMTTDPPYGISYGDIANSRSRAASVRKGGTGKNYKTHKNKEIENDDLDGAALQKFLEEAIRCALPHLIANPAFYLWHPMLTQGTFFAAAAAAADILIHRQIVWVKPSLILGRGDYHWRHELCFYGWIRGKRCVWLSGHDETTIWEVGRENDGIHPTQKPVELFARPIRNHVQPGGLVYEPFSGSGSQIIAAEMTARRCFAIEIDPSYVQIAIERWQNFTGKKAILEGDGRDFETIKRERERSRKPAKQKVG
jgi:DNA modification methylase